LLWCGVLHGVIPFGDRGPAPHMSPEGSTRGPGCACHALAQAVKELRGCPRHAIPTRSPPSITPTTPLFRQLPEITALFRWRAIEWPPSVGDVSPTGHQLEQGGQPTNRPHPTFSDLGRGAAHQGAAPPSDRRPRRPRPSSSSCRKAGNRRPVASRYPVRSARRPQQAPRGPSARTLHLNYWPGGLDYPKVC
jgi:hypothetical protein